MTAPLTAAELHEIEERAKPVCVHELGICEAESPVAREDVERLIATVKALRALLHGLAWNDTGIDLVLPSMSTAEASR